MKEALALHHKELKEIWFGTSGWRGIIADDFTYDNVKIASQAICDFLKEKYQYNNTGKGSKNDNNLFKIIIGYDTRFLSEEFAKCSAGVFCANGFHVLFCDSFTPTPVISVAILKDKTLGAVNITASHNPYNYNGLKFSPDWGGPALPEDTKIITEKANDHLLKNSFYRFMGYEEAKAASLLQEINYIDHYINLMAKKIDLSMIAGNKNLHAVIDPLHGTGARVISKILEKEKSEIIYTEINSNRDAFFGEGKAPDPSDKNLGVLKSTVKKYNRNNPGFSAIGIATDGDADRYGIIDEDGTFVEPNMIFSLLYNYYILKKNIKGDVARSVATTALVDRVARHYGFKVYETPVGFKYLGKLIAEKKVIMAGEESSGLTVIGHTPDKDGILACLLVLEMVSCYKKPLTVIIKEFLEKFGPIFTKRINEPVDKERFKATIDKKMEAFPDVFEGKRVINKSYIDGYKIFFDDDSWLLARLSGTENLMRIYGEADTGETLNSLMSFFKNYLLS